MGQLGVASTELLQNGLKHLWLLLDNLAKLLELSVMAEEVQIAESSLSTGTGSASRSRSNGGGRSVSPTTCTATASTTATLLCGEIEKVNALSTVATSISAGSGGNSGRGSCSWGLCLLLLQVLGDTLSSSQHLIRKLYVLKGSPANSYT